MKPMLFTLLLLIVLCTGGVYAWRYQLKRTDRRTARKSMLRAAVSLVIGAGAVILVFSLLSLNSWKVF